MIMMPAGVIDALIDSRESPRRLVNMKNLRLSSLSEEESKLLRGKEKKVKTGAMPADMWESLVNKYDNTMEGNASVF